LSSCTTPELKQKLLKEIGTLQLRPLPDAMADTVPYLTEVTVREDGVQVVASMAERRGWWLKLGSTKYPLVAAAAARLLSAHATSAAPERAWSAMGRLTGPSRNALKKETAEKLCYIIHNSPAAAGRPAADQAVALDWIGSESEADAEDAE
jgi:hypothetical protein